MKASALRLCILPVCNEWRSNLLTDDKQEWITLKILVLKKQCFRPGLRESQSCVAHFLTASLAALNKNARKHKIKTLSASLILPMEFTVLLLACSRTCYDWSHVLIFFLRGPFCSLSCPIPISRREVFKEQSSALNFLTSYKHLISVG